MKPLARVLASLIVLSGCTSATRVTLPNGVQGITVECEDSVSRCYQKAADVCAPLQYEIENQMSTGRSWLITNPTFSVTIVCKNPPQERPSTPPEKTS